MEKLKKVTGSKNIHHLEIIKTNILSKIHDDSKMWPLEHQGFPLIWPGDLVSDIKWPSFKLDQEIIKTNILSNIYDYLTVWSVNSSLLIWPGDLVFDPKWPSFKLDLEIIKTNMLCKIHDDCLKNVTTRVLKFSSLELGDLVSNLT